MVVSNALICSFVVGFVCLIGSIITAIQMKRLNGSKTAFSVFFLGFLIFGLTPFFYMVLTQPY